MVPPSLPRAPLLARPRDPLEMSATLVLHGENLTHTFGDGETATRALSSVSLSLGRGETVLLLGPSGSGKSTLLAALSGLLRPDEGRVEVLGVDLWRLSEGERKQLRLRHFGFVFQGYNLFPALNARQQLELVLRWGEEASSREARSRADEMLDALGLSSKARLRPPQLSGGEKQRVAVARALLKRPTICFADEPTSALDWGNGRRVVELLRQIARVHGTAVLVVSHDHRLIPFADRVLHLDDGRMVEPQPGQDATHSPTGV